MGPGLSTPPGRWDEPSSTPARAQGDPSHSQREVPPPWPCCTDQETAKQLHGALCPGGGRWGSRQSQGHPELLPQYPPHALWVPRTKSLGTSRPTGCLCKLPNCFCLRSGKGPSLCLVAEASLPAQPQLQHAWSQPLGVSLSTTGPSVSTPLGPGSKGTKHSLRTRWHQTLCLALSE